MSFYDNIKQAIENEAEYSRINLEALRQICPPLNDLFNNREVDFDDIDNILKVFHLSCQFHKIVDLTNPVEVKYEEHSSND